MAFYTIFAVDSLLYYTTCCETTRWSTSSGITWTWPVKILHSSQTWSESRVSEQRRNENPYSVAVGTVVEFINNTVSPQPGFDTKHISGGKVLNDARVRPPVRGSRDEIILVISHQWCISKDNLVLLCSESGEYGGSHKLTHSPPTV